MAEDKLITPLHNPPIIIRDGSFTIHYKSGEFGEPLISGDNDRRPLRYRKANFGDIVAVNVVQIKSSGEVPHRFADASGITLRIWLQEFIDGEWDPQGIEGQAHVKATGNSGSRNFQLELKGLSDPQNSSDPEFTTMRQHIDNYQATFRFGRIRVNDKEVPHEDNDRYKIEIYGGR